MKRRGFGLLLAAALLAGCNGARDLNEAPVPLGDFNLVHNVVVAPKVQKVPLGRELPTEQMIETLRSAVAERFDRYEGARGYHFGISIESYFLAPPGVPVVAAPKSAMIIQITVWDDARNLKLTDKPHQITVIESLDQGPLVGSGYTKSAEEQFRNLSQNAVKQIENYLVKMNAENGWFNTSPDAEETAGDAPQDVAETDNG
ncbi:hypothetical protein [Sulfitobacter sp. S190]|uniref:hypothetical protein n=1 Tax=Sulfitobacter sp. S190 TaxID=2867022 RepID=UPI0021A64392|nr:hypothetical protein [Sulfitobacter sp. S190]UWR22934.1 hypothetical protein K3756_02735 [Sulfitobacter sp. S190]